MATLDEFKALRDGVPASVQGELFRLMTTDPDASIRRMVEIAAIVGGGSGVRETCCQEEAHVEPWGRCPGMGPMRKRLFGGSSLTV